MNEPTVEFLEGEMRRWKSDRDAAWEEYKVANRKYEEAKEARDTLAGMESGGAK